MPLPSRLHIALETPHEIVIDIFKILLNICLENKTLDGFAKNINDSLNKMRDFIVTRTSNEMNSHLMFRRETMEHIVNVVEVINTFYMQASNF